MRPLVGAREQAAATMRTRPLPHPVPGRATHVREQARRHSPATTVSNEQQKEGFRAEENPAR